MPGHDKHLPPRRPAPPGRPHPGGPVPRLRAERTWYTLRVKPLAREPLAWLATAELIGVVCWLRPAELIGVACWLRSAELISVACWLRSAELIGVVRWLRSAEPVADFRSARAVRTCHLDLHHRYLLPTAAVTLALRRMLRPVGRVAVSTSRRWPTCARATAQGRGRRLRTRLRKLARLSLVGHRQLAIGSGAIAAARTMGARCCRSGSWRRSGRR
jgi:hypothetical protein